MLLRTEAVGGKQKDPQSEEIMLYWWEGPLRFGGGSGLSSIVYAEGEMVVWGGNDSVPTIFLISCVLIRSGTGNSERVYGRVPWRWDRPLC